MVVVGRKGTWQHGVSAEPLEACELGASCKQQGHGIMVFPACSVRHSVLPRVYACSSSLTIKQPHNQRPTPGSHFVSCTVCMYVPESSQKQGYIRGQYAESEWVVSRGLSDKTGLRNDKPKERSSRPAVAFRRPLREARGRMPAQTSSGSMFRACRLLCDW